MVVTNLEGIRNQDAWTGLTVVGMFASTRLVHGEGHDEVHFFIGSRTAPAKVYGDALRGHWTIENGLHWQLDITFGEDANRVQRRHGAENLALVRRLALTLLKRQRGPESIASKRFAAAMNTGFLEEILCAGRNLGNG